MLEFSLQLFLSLTLFLLTTLAAPTTSRASELDKGQEVYLKIYRIAADNPTAGKKAAKDLLKQWDPDANQSEWIQVYWYLLNNDRDALDPVLQTQERIRGFARLAEKNGNSFYALQLDYLLASEASVGSDKQAVQSALDIDFAKRAEKIGNFRFAARLLAEQAFQAYNLGDMKKSLSVIQQSYNLLNTRVERDDTQMMEIKGYLASFLDYSGETQKADEIYQDLIARYRESHLRYALADTLGNYSLFLMHSKRFLEAEKNLKEVWTLGGSLGSTLTQSRAMKGLAFSQAQQGMHQKAIASYKKGIVLMTSSHEDPVAIADTQRLLADSYVEEKQWNSALEALDLAVLEPTAMKDKDWERSVQETRVKAYVGLGRIEDALRYTKRINELLKKILEEEKEAELSRLKVSMGLQLEEQKNSLLVDQNKMKDEKLQDAETLRRFFYGMAVLAVLVILLLLVVLRQTLRAKHSRERMHRILEHIEEGILSIGSNMQVEADLSPYLKRLLGVNPDEKQKKDTFASLMHAADLSQDIRSTIRSTLQACIGEETLAWDLNSDQLPHEVSIHGGDRFLRLDWQPIIGENKIIQSVLVTVRDITARKKLQSEVTTAKARASRLEQRLTDILQIDAVRAESFVEEARGILPEVRAQIETDRDLNLCYRSLHTLKGVARTLGFKEMSSIVHDIEDQVDLERKVLKDRPVALELLQQLEQTVQEYEDIIRKVFFRQKEATSRHAVSLVDLVSSSLPTVREMLGRAGMQLSKVDIHDHIEVWPKDWLETVHLILIHGLANCADHGFILPRRRGASVTKLAKISIAARLVSDGMEVELNDNGFGLDFERLQILAEKVGFHPKDGESVADVVFLDGVTTADQVSRSSGRGIGMASVRHAVEELSGKVRLRPNPEGQGSSLWVQLPQKFGSN